MQTDSKDLHVQTNQEMFTRSKFRIFAARNPSGVINVEVTIWLFALWQAKEFDEKICFGK